LGFFGIRESHETEQLAGIQHKYRSLTTLHGVCPSSSATVGSKAVR
jgi:hypothetical protein